MNKKNLLKVMALPLLAAACSSEDVLTEQQSVKGQYNVPQVDVVLGVGEADSRLAGGKWELEYEGENKDVLGFAWLGDGIDVIVNGKAFQNHPLFAIGPNTVKPETSIYVGAYYTYTPYDYSLKAVGSPRFDISQQPLACGVVGYNTIAAKKSIWISPEWVDITIAGDVHEYNKAGIGQKTTIKPVQFTNKVNLQLTYKNYEVENEFKNLTVAYKNSLGQDIAATKFTYTPDAEQGTSDWKNVSLATGVIAKTPTAGGGFMEAPKEAKGVDATGSTLISLEGTHAITKEYVESLNNATESFYYNALPAREVVTDATTVELKMTTTYGILTVTKPVSQIAKTQLTKWEGGKEVGYYAEEFDGVYDAVDPTKLLGAYDYDQSFIQTLQKGGKLEAEIDFFTAIMHGMCVEDDTHLQKLLNYYKNYKKGTVYAEAKTGTDIVLNLDNTDGKFRLSTTSIDLIREINAGTASTEKYITIQPCIAHSGGPIVIFNGVGEESNEVRDLNDVFEGTTVTSVSLANEAWSWANGAVKNFGPITTIYNDGQLTVDATNVEAAAGFVKFVNNYETGVITLSKETTVLVKIDVENMGKIYVSEDAEYRAFESTLTNDVEAVVGVREGVWGRIYNYGVIGAPAAANGKINNYGYIFHNAGAKTFVTANGTASGSFYSEMTATNKLGVIEMSEADPNITVKAGNQKGIIACEWTATEDGVYVTPENVKYNYLIVKDDIEFLAKPTELKYIEFAAKKIVLKSIDENFLKLDGVIVPAKCDVTLNKYDYLTANEAFVKGTIYNGGTVKVTGNFESYFNGESADKYNIIDQEG